MLLPDGRQIRSVHGKNLVGRIFQQSEGGIVIAQRLVDTRIGFVEEQNQPRQRSLCFVGLQERRGQLAQPRKVVALQKPVRLRGFFIPSRDQQAEILLQAVAAETWFMNGIAFPPLWNSPVVPGWSE